MKKISTQFRTLATLSVVMILVSLLVACLFESAAPTTNTATDTVPKTLSETHTETVPQTLPETVTNSLCETTAITEPSKEPITLNIGTYNIRCGISVNFKTEELGADIKDKKLDIVGIQQIDQFTDRAMQTDMIKELSDSSGLPYYAFFKAMDYRGGEYGIGVLSRYPITKATKTELYSGTEEPRVLGHAVIDVNGVVINFFVTHLSFESKELRGKQFATIAERVAELDNFILVGDFNTTDFSEYAPIKNAGMANNSEHSSDTYRRDGESLSLDNIVFSEGGWTFGAPEYLFSGKSDHCLLFATGTFDPYRTDEE